MCVAGYPPSDSTASTLPGFAGVLGCLVFASIVSKFVVEVVNRFYWLCYLNVLLSTINFSSIYSCKTLSGVVLVIVKSCLNACASSLASFSGPVIKTDVNP